jgi:hypothetical protein
MIEIDEKVELFEEKLRAQAELYSVMIGLARKQVDQISARDVDALTLSLERKKTVVDEIEQIGMSADPLRRFWESHKDEVGEPTRMRLRAVVEEIRTLLEELLEIEAGSQRKLGITKDALEEQMQELSDSARAVHSYAPKPDEKPRFMDQTG